MNYIGSKLSLLPFLEQSIFAVADKNCRSFCDLFAGTGMVGRHFKQKGLNIIANDLQHYSYVLNRHYIGNNKVMNFEQLLPTLPQTDLQLSDTEKVFAFLDNIEGKQGFMYQNYCGGGTAHLPEPRLYFTDENGMQCDAIRSTIEQWREEKRINEDEYFFLLASLIEGMDKIANTASVYGAYLKKIKKSASQKLKLKPAELLLSDGQHQVYCGDSNTLIQQIETDILYLDPPYNHRQYAPNYHILETISRYDNPVIKGKTGLRAYSEQKSDWSIKSKVKDAFAALIEQANARYIFLSYNNEGLLSPEDIKQIMSSKGQYGTFTQKHNRFKADKTERRNHIADSTLEYLHYVVVH